ncbi:MAG TPA: periplasmic heavy metal sensor [Methylovirgula sp.]|nr:periplasmic heavy metal sensor [Methylovirgula sp.]
MLGSRIPLTVSIVLNVFLLGVLAGSAIWFEMNKRAPVRSGWIAAGQQLPEPERGAFRQALRTARHDAWQTILDARQAKREAADLLLQPTLDSNALSAALERMRKDDAAVRALVEQRFVEFAAASSPEARRILAEGLMPSGAVQPKK